MNLWQRIQWAFSPKAVSFMSGVLGDNLFRSSPRNYEGFSEEGYKKNVVVRRCVSMIAESVASIPPLVGKVNPRGEFIENPKHEVLKLLERPNEIQNRFEFIRDVVSFLVISGNTFALTARKNPKNLPLEMWPLRPDQMKIKSSGKIYMPSGYEFKPGTNAIQFPYETKQIMHIKLFNPTDYLWGCSPLEAAAAQVDQTNAADIWNLSLLQNGARPSGMVVNEKSQNLTPDQLENLKRELNESYVAAKNAGKLMLLEGGLKYQELSINPKDMDFLNSKNTSKSDIALAYAVPGQLVGLENQQKFDNFEKAMLWFYLNTGLPLFDLVYGRLGRQVLQPGEEFRPNKDKIEALQPLKEMQWNKMKEADWLSPNEKREGTDYAPYDPNSENPADRLYISSAQMPIEFATEDLSLDEEDEEEDAEDFFDDDEEEDEEKAFSSGSPRSARQIWARNMRKRRVFERKFRYKLSVIFNREGKSVMEAVKNGDPLHMENIALDEVEANESNFRKLYAEALRETAIAFGLEVIREIPKSCSRRLTKEDMNTHFESFLNLYIREHSAEMIKKISPTTKRRIKRVIKEGITNGDTQEAVAKSIGSLYKSFSKARTHTIARTEVHNASENGKLAAVKSVGTTSTIKKEWVHSNKGPERDRHYHKQMNGKRVGVDELFEVPSDDGVDLMSGPGDSSAPADQVINCTCVSIFVTEEQ